MGVCSSRQKEQQKIDAQIKQTVHQMQEDENKLKEEQEIQDQLVNSDDEGDGEEEDGDGDGEPLAGADVEDEPQNEEPKDHEADSLQVENLPEANDSTMKKPKRGGKDTEESQGGGQKEGKKRRHHHSGGQQGAPSKKKEEQNYQKKQEYHLAVNYFIQQFVKEEAFPHYVLSVGVGFQNFDYEVQLKGIPMYDPEKRAFHLMPTTFKEAYKFSRFLTFFSNDNYFNADPDQSTTYNYFERLLTVERRVTVEGLSHSPTKRISKRQSVQLDEPSPMKRQPSKQKSQTVKEMLEIIAVFDLEYQARWHTLLFHLLLQTKHPQLKNYLITIDEAYMLYDRPPQLDAPNLYKIAIFYPYMSYSLKDLHGYLQHEQMELSRIAFFKLACDLLEILIECYKVYLYRLNITLTSVFYVPDSKRFRLQSFGRIRSYIPFEDDVDVQLSRKEAKDEKRLIQTFNKDAQATFDIILLFRRVRGTDLKNIKSLHKKAKDDDETPTAAQRDYVDYIDQLLSPEDPIDKELNVLLKPNETDSKIEKRVDTIQENVNELRRQIHILETQLTQQELQRAQENSQDSRSDNEGEGEEERQLSEFDTDFTLYPMAKSPDKFTEEQYKYKQMLYSSITMNRQCFLENCQDFLMEPDLDTNIKVQGIILNSQAQIMNELDDETRKQTQQNLLEQAVHELQKNPVKDNMETLHFHLLITLLVSLPTKPYPLILQLQRALHKQFEYKVKMGSKLRGNNEARGKIEMRKTIVQQIFLVQHLVTEHRFSQAVVAMQKIISLQIKQNLNNSILYAYTLFENGLICERTLQQTSAMLNLEMSKSIYDLYFPQYRMSKVQVQAAQATQSKGQQAEQEFQLKKSPINNLATLNLSVLEFHLGIVYFNLHDQENALKCLKRAKKFRSGLYDAFADELLEITIQLLRIYVEQEETGQAIELCQQYARLMEKHIKLKVPIKGRLVAKLQFIMAAIFKASGVLLSAIRYFTRANRTMTAQKNSTYLIQLHIQQMIKELLITVREKAYIANNMASEPQNMNFTSISDSLKPYFNNQFFRKMANPRTQITNPEIGMNFIVAHGLFKNGDMQAGFNRINLILNAFKKIKKDELHGLALELLGVMYLEQDKIDQAHQYLMFALEVHERYLQFPLKEHSILRCNIFRLLIYAMKRDYRQLCEQFERIEQVIYDFHATLQWNSVASQVTYNKFQVLSHKVGIKILYQILEIENIIEHYYQTKKKMTQFSKAEIDKISAVGMQARKLFLHHAKNTIKQVEQRRSCMLGDSQRASISIKRQASIVTPKNQNLLGIRVLDTVAIPQDPEHKKIRDQLNLNDEKPTVTKVLRGAMQQQIENDIFSRETQIIGKKQPRTSKELEPISEDRQTNQDQSKVQNQTDAQISRSALQSNTDRQLGQGPNQEAQKANQSFGAKSQTKEGQIVDKGKSPANSVNQSQSEMRKTKIDPFAKVSRVTKK